jgi:ferredoxin
MAMNFPSIIGRLRKIQAPVLSCNVRPGLAAHEKTVCLGFLSEEHLIALLSSLRKPLQMNLTECRDCRNGFIVAVLRERLRSVAEKTSVNAFENIKLVEEKADLDYQEISHDRRGFFRALKNLTAREAMGFFDNTKGGEHTLSYSDKAVPLRRELLNSSLSALSEGKRKRVLEHYYFDATVDETCNNCFACVGMCPTGALKSAEEDPDTMLFFNSSLCTGCGLCEIFCMKDAIHLKEGFSGVLPFRFNSTQGVSPRVDSETCKGCHQRGTVMQGGIRSL